MTRPGIILTMLLLLPLSAVPGRAFVLGANARVEIVPRVEIAPLAMGAATSGAAGTVTGLRLHGPDCLTAHVLLEEDDGMGGRRRTSVEDPFDTVVRWDEAAWSCHLTVTYE